MQELLNFISSIFLLLLGTPLHSDKQIESDLQPVTVTPSGTIFGLYNVTRRGRRFESYRGIRYAEPPIGDLRFQPPKMIDKYESPVNATRDGHVCPQAWNNCCRTPPYEDMDEDCLFMNVYTPLKKDRKTLLPVIFFIHQSAFLAKTARSDIFEPNYLLDRDIVLVTFNYRLATLGFLSTGDKIAPGNNAMKDQVIALRWVQKNIRAFGGDPNSVTISGCSSGSVSVIAHMVSPMSKGLFHRAIAISGSPTKIDKMPSDQYTWAEKQARLLDCPTTNSSVIVACLKTKPWRDFARTYDKFYVFDRNPIHQWDMVVENDFGQERFLAIDLMEAIRQGNMTHVPIIINQNTAEFFSMAPPIITNSTILKQMNEDWEMMASLAFLLPKTNLKKALELLRTVYLQNRPLYLNSPESLERLGSLYCDSSVAFPVHRLANLMCRHSTQPVWYFFFTYVGECGYYISPYTGKPDRAVHQDETLYLFPSPYYCEQIGLIGRDAVIVDRMTAMWYNFAKYGDPNPIDADLGLYWPPMTPDNRTYLKISDDLTLHKNLREKRFELWEQLHPIDYN
ncbi:juvenile hormone esterase-like [Aricia agestis]|uniref:juvenile hormone esterase-like n=1 Tax=Aricia agestis TaxID=91739 RepID=UPI001C20520E|nr:juvenile hormone esterase-like [Aricia agestis]